MNEHNDFRYQKLIWSAVLVLALFIWVAKIVHQTPSILGFYGFFIVGATIFSAITFIFTILRLFRLVKRDSLVYIFTATTLSGIATYGVYLLFNATVKISVIEFLVFMIPVVLSFCAIIDIFILEVPYIIALYKKEK